MEEAAEEGRDDSELVYACRLKVLPGGIVCTTPALFNDLVEQGREIGQKMREDYPVTYTPEFARRFNALAEPGATVKGQTAGQGELFPA